MRETFELLFVEWDLGTWANVLEVVGFIIMLLTLAQAIRIKSEVNQLKMDYILRKRISDHLKKFRALATSLKDLLRNYETSIEPIKETLVMIQSELQSLHEKLDDKNAKKIKKLIDFISKRRACDFKQNRDQERYLILVVKDIFPEPFDTSYNDLWTIYLEVHGLINELDNLRIDKKKALTNG